MFQIYRSFPILLEHTHSSFQRTLRSLVSANLEPKSPAVSTNSNKNADVYQHNTTQSKDEIVTDKYGAITIISLNRPEEKNIINRRMAAKLTEAITNFENDVSAKIGILHGIGGNFSAGYDLNELMKDAKEPATFLDNGLAGPTRRMPKKPMICGISGSCVSIGFELALMCDLRIVETTAILGFTQRKYGVPIMDAGTVRLPAIVGATKALDIILTGREVTAQEACDMGLALRVVTAGTALGQAINLAMNMVKYPQETLNHDRNAVYASMYSDKSFEQNCLNEVTTLSQGVMSSMAAGLAEDFNDMQYIESFMPDWEKAEYRREQELAKTKQCSKQLD